MSVSTSGLELGGGEGVLGGWKEGDTEGTGAAEKAGATLEAEAGASKAGSLGEANVSNAWMVSSGHGETLELVERVATTGSTSGFLEGVVTNLMTDGVDS